MDKFTNNSKQSKIFTPSATSRRNSISGEVSCKDLLLEMQKMREQMQEQMLDNRQKMEEKMEKMFKEELGNMKKELKEELKADLKGIRNEMEGMQKEMKEIKKENGEAKKSQKKLEEKINKLEEINAKLERQQELMAIAETDFLLRFRNIEEQDNQDLRGIITDLTAEILNITPEEMTVNIDRIQRINSSYAKRNKVPRDITVHFSRKAVRDEVLKSKSKGPISYKGKNIIILKEFTPTSMSKRKKYYFLTDELRKHQVKFKWERTEGISLTFRENKYWLTSEEKAKDFYKDFQKHYDNKKQEEDSGNSEKPKTGKPAETKDKGDYKKQEKKRQRPNSSEDLEDEKPINEEQKAPEDDVNNGCDDLFK